MSRSMSTSLVRNGSDEPAGAVRRALSNACADAAVSDSGCACPVAGAGGESRDGEVRRQQLGELQFLQGPFAHFRKHAEQVVPEPATSLPGRCRYLRRAGVAPQGDVEVAESGGLDQLGGDGIDGGDEDSVRAGTCEGPPSQP